jgi:hypothetical protein
MKDNLKVYSRNYICVVVYDRYQNLQRWLHCWNLSNHHDFELVIIHNTDTEQPIYKDICDYYGVQYIQRVNLGFDTAPFQDICLERLEGFNNDWNKIMWATDDWFPMHKNFIKDYVNHLHNGVGVVCTEISDVVKKHIRTSAFLITKETSKKITFDVDVITTKDHCYDFEHRSANALYEQIINMGLSVELVAPIHIAPIWDSGHRADLNRMDEHNSVFYSTQKVIIICPIYKCYPQIISSMILQTHKDWELHLIHDGEADQFLRDYVALVNDDRIKFVETKERVGNYGHSYRQQYLKELRKSDGDFIVITNGDNYHTPNFLESMVKGFKDGVVATYCDSMVHSYFGWGVINCRMERGFIDCANVMVRKDVACHVGWNDIESHSSDWTYFEDIAKVHGWESFAQVYGCLLIHN